MKPCYLQLNTNKHYSVKPMRVFFFNDYAYAWPQCFAMEYVKTNK